MTHLRRTLVVAGHGMVGHRLVQAAIERGLTERYDIVVVGEEPRPAYDRVALTSFFGADSADELSLLPSGRYDDPRVRLVLDTVVAGIDRACRSVTLGSGEEIGYDTLVLATDGFFEWASATGEQYGIDRLEAFVANHAHEMPAKFIESLHADVVAHAAGQAQPDDLTVVIVKRLSEQDSHSNRRTQMAVPQALR